MKKGFTLSEVLITLTILGVIAALVMPGMFTNSTKKSLKAAKGIEKKHMVEAINTMRLKNQLSASTNEEFADKLQKYLKVGKRCTAANMTECFAPSFKNLDGSKTFQTNTLSKGADLGQASSTSAIAGLVLANGTTVMLAFNPTCNDTVDEYNGSDDLTTCLSILYDVNGLKGPNRISAGADSEDGNDILAQNVTISSCDGTKIGAICVDANDTAYTPINTCSGGSAEDKAYDPTGDANPYCLNNYWAGAKKACSAQGKRLPTGGYTWQDPNAELHLMYLNSVTGSGYYWSSRVYSGHFICIESISNGWQNNAPKKAPLLTRCVK